MSLEGVDPPQGNKILRALNRGGGFPRLQLIPPQGIGAGGVIPEEFIRMLFEGSDTMAYQNLDIMVYETGTKFIPADWLDSRYTHRLLIKIKANVIPGSLSDFPLLFNSIVPNFIDNTRSDGFDFLFALPNKEELDYERQFYDPINGELISHVRIPNIGDNVEIYLYYKNEDAVDVQNPGGVWDSNYRVVYHMNQASGDLIDSTVSPRNATPFDNLNYSVPGQIGKAVGFPSSGYFTASNTIPVLGAGARTVSFWARPFTFPDGPGVFQAGITGNDGQDFSWRTKGGDDNWLFQFWGGGDLPVTLVGSKNNWHHYVCIFNGIRAVMYFDGVKKLDDNTALNTQAFPFTIGRWINFRFDGEIDEMRYSDIARTQDWAIAEYNNQVAPESFYDLVRVETLNVPDNWFDEAFKHRVELRVKDGQVPSTQTDFPFLFNSKTTDIEFNANADGSDFRFVLPDGTELKYEIQDYDDATGTLIAHVLLPEIKDGTVVYLYYNNPGATDNQDVPAVWDSNYHAVYHMSQVPFPVNGLFDSTSNGFNINPNFMVQANGQIGKAVEFNGSSSFIAAPAITKPTLPITFEMWIKSDSTTPVGIFESSGLVSDALRNHSAGKIEWETADPDVTLGVTNTQFHHLVVVYSYDGNRHIDFYRDGVKIGATANGTTDSEFSWGTGFRFGEIDFGVLGRYIGILDEFRISTGLARSADWIKTSYNNQVDTSAFYNIGPAEILPP